MIKNIVGIFKTIGEGLQFEDTGESLSYVKKLEVLSNSTADSSLSLARLPVRILLVSDRACTFNAVEHAVEICSRNSAILELLYIGVDKKSLSLNFKKVLPLLERETDLDFQLTRREGELITVLQEYLVSRQDIVLVLLSVNEKSHKRKIDYLYIERNFPESKYPAINVI